MKHGLLVLGLLVVCSALQAEEYYFNFEQRRFDQVNLLYMQGTQELTEFTNPGLLIAVPGGKKTMGLGIKLRFTVQGDFEIMGVFDIVQADAPPKDSYGVGASIYIATSSERSDAASVALFERAREGRVLVAHRAETPAEGKRNHRQYFRPTNHRSGVLAFKREGERLGYYFAPALDREFELIHTADFPADDLNLVRFTAEAGNSTAAVKVLWKEIRIRASKLPGMYQPKIVQAQPAWISWLLWTAIGAGVVALAVAGWIYYRRYAYLP